MTGTNNPRNYPDTIPSAESGRPMTRGEKLVTFEIDGCVFSYKQPGWWCSLTDPDDMEGQLVDDDNQVGETARQAAKASPKTFLTTVTGARIARKIQDLDAETVNAIARSAADLSTLDDFLAEDGKLETFAKVAQQEEDLIGEPNAKSIDNKAT